MPLSYCSYGQSCEMFNEVLVDSFSRALTKEKWKELTTSYPQIKDTGSLLAAPTMKAGMKKTSRNDTDTRKLRSSLPSTTGLLNARLHSS